MKDEASKVKLSDVRAFKHRINPEERQGAYGLYFIRPFSIYFTFLALRLGLSANLITVLQTMVGLVGAACLAFREDAIVVSGLFLLQLGFVLDNVDGEVARIRNQASLTGKYLDTIGHEFVIPSIFFFLGVGTFLREGGIEAVVFGFLAGLFSLRLDISTMYHEACQVIEKGQNRLFEYYATLRGEQAEHGNLYRKKNESSPLRIIYAMFAYPAVMNIITALLLLDMILRSTLLPQGAGFAYWFLMIYGVLVPVRRVYTVWKIASTHAVEDKYLSLMRMRGEKD